MTAVETEKSQMADQYPLKRPFLKWAGSKTKLVKAIKPLLPVGPFRFIEPFVGAGAVFLNTEYPANLLCDANADLIGVYRQLQQFAGKFVEQCQKLFASENNSEDKFYEFRAEFNKGGDPERHAALFIYLNRHCYNGLCRYNQNGKFNTPFGRYEKPYFPREEMLVFGAKLQKAQLKCQDFRVAIAQAGEGDVVYCDPPYIPLSLTASFTDYAPGGFSIGEQADLAASAIEAAGRGATVIISNHDMPLTRQLYRKASKIIPILVSRTISCDGEKRGKAKELIAVFDRPSAASKKSEPQRVRASRLESGENHGIIGFSNPTQPCKVLPANLWKDRMKTLGNTTRHWLRENGYADAASPTPFRLLAMK